MRELLLDVLRSSPAGRQARYVELRWVRDQRRYLSWKDVGEARRPERSDEATSVGFGVRVLVESARGRGAWGFAARPAGGDDAAQLRAALAEALAIARAAAAVRAAPTWFADEEACHGSYATPVRLDPFDAASAPAGALLERLAGWCAGLRQHAGAHAHVASAHLFARRQRKILVTSDGTAVDQTLVWTGAGMKLGVRAGDEQAQRAYPLDLDGGVGAGGLELVDDLDFPGHVARVADEAVALLSAPPCPAGSTTLVVSPAQMALQIHESCGHATESDRAFGDEVSLAGGSFLSPARLGRFRYGSAHVNLSADASQPRGLGTFAWDDEGVPARKTPLVARGQHVGYLTSRETAARLGLPRSGGCVRADSWQRVPMVRMVNVSLEPTPGGPSLAELVADTDDGILVGSNRSWSIDDLRLNFQFGCEIAWEIKRGKLGRVLKNPIYTGATPRFWAGCDAVGGPADYQLFGLLSCGKGDPMQLMGVAHGSPPARFRGVEVGSG